MDHALRLAARGLGQVSPNPAVGCVIVSQNGRIAGRGLTQAGGRPHAETVALAQAGPQARGATVYVTLEPCSHHGQTPPCAQALIDAGVARVVSAVEDCDLRVQGRGHAMLRAAGVSVEVGVCEAEARALNAGFFKRVQRGLPWLTVKIASSLDGMMALANGESQWITGPLARAEGHALRAQHDAVLTGIGTALRDDPALDCRLPGLEGRSPAVVLLDPALRLPGHSKIATRAPGRRTIVYCAPGSESADALRGQGLDVRHAPLLVHGQFDLSAVFADLGALGFTRVLAEAGPRLTRSLLTSGLCDQVVWFRGSQILGADASPATAALSLTSLRDAPAFRRTQIRALGPDLMETFEPES
ncbi:MAG TPA: bifunctional diaminohydroxyphosphoribosylaminopyrimidine deaminase/5-amino-6-(5-phosphoribosylamino)uracil reductase RibD [Alphaproteobacteria bacterium]|nr:bifunctional diaminohydroxyphosphoribosylaminopyrimidine deaminase/5-amino-6-(5-phosphoribosylamino)uracil reductase RibD [Alphaproteobacteria bacterium]